MKFLPKFLPFLVTVLSYLPLEHSSRSQLLCLQLIRCLVTRITMPYFTKTASNISQMVFRRVMTRVLQLFGDDEIKSILMVLNKSGPHNIRALRSVLCRNFLPPAQLSLTFDFIDFMHKSESVEHWLDVLSQFPQLTQPNARCTGFSLVAQELRTLYQQNKLFSTLLSCQSLRLSKRILYNASRNQTRSFRAFMNSFKRMKKALRGELNLVGLNMYDLTDCILSYFFDEMQKMGRIDLQRLYEVFAEGSLTKDYYIKVDSEGCLVPFPLRPTEISFVPFSDRDARVILDSCNKTFMFPQIGSKLKMELFFIAKEQVSFDDSCVSIGSQGMFFILSMISVHQSGDPFLAYIIRSIYHSYDPIDDFIDFHVEKLLHVSLINGSIPEIVRLWKLIYPGRWSQPAFLSTFRDTRISSMFRMFYDIVNTPECFGEIVDFISQNSSSDSKSVRMSLRNMQMPSLASRHNRMFYPFI